MTGLIRRQTTARAPTLAAFLFFGDTLVRLVAEAFVKAANKKSAYERLARLLVALYNPGDRATLGNVEAASCVLRFLMREDVQRIAEVSSQQSGEIEALWRACGEGEQAGQPTQYEEFIRQRFDSWAPAIPNMLAELKARGKETSDAQSDEVGGLVNWKKVYPIASRCLLFKRFQMQPYRLFPIPQIQDVILRKTTLSDDEIEDKIEERLRIQIRDGQEVIAPREVPE
jgi:hypothetical protein